MSELPTIINKCLKEEGDEFLNIAITRYKFDKKFKRNLILFTSCGKNFFV